MTVSKDRWKSGHCQTTFSNRQGTLVYRRKTDPETMICVLILLAFGECACFVLAHTVKWQEAGRCVGIRVCHLCRVGELPGYRIVPPPYAHETAKESA